MRLLVACPSCGQQFDASKKFPGHAFECVCGAEVRVPVPEPHEAHAVRCSACGGARQTGDARCSFCGADFTLHERDLDTVCPSCTARVSNAARFCHRCGVALAATLVAGEVTHVRCPACEVESSLSLRTVAHGMSALECSRCTGLWLGQHDFGSLVQEARARAIDALGAGNVRRSGGAPQSGPFYRRCVMCNEFMRRSNFGRMSGVIIDVCAVHGVWFDADELQRILEWVRDGGLQKAERQQARENRAVPQGSGPAMMELIEPREVAFYTTVIELVKALLS